MRLLGRLACLLVPPLLLLPLLHSSFAMISNQCLSESYPRPTNATRHRETIEIGLIGGIFSKKNQLRLPTVGAINYAITKETDSLNLKVVYCNTDNDFLKSVRHASTLCHENRVRLIVSVDHDCRVQATIAAAYNMPMIGVNCVNPALSNKVKYPTFTRVHPQPGAIALPLISLLRNNSWSKIAFISKASSKYKQVSDTLLDSFRAHNISVLLRDEYDSFPYDHPVDYPSIRRKTLDSVVERSYQKARIFVVLGYRSETLALLHCFDKRGLLAGGKYFVIGVDKEPQARGQQPPWLQYWEAKGFQFTKDSYNAYMHISLREESKDNKDIRRQMQVAVLWFLRAPPFNMSRKKANSLQLPPLFQAAFLVDSVLLFEGTMARIMKNYSREKWTDGRFISEQMRGSKYTGALGYLNRINQNGDTEGNYTVLRIVNNRRKRSLRNAEPTKINFVYYGNFIASEEPSGLPIFKTFENAEWSWIGGERPRDEPRCGFNNERCQTSNTRLKVVLGVMGSCAVIILIIGSFLYRNHRFQQELDLLLWKIDYKELVLITENSYSRANSGERAPQEAETIPNHTHAFPEAGDPKEVAVNLEENEALLNSNSASSVNSGSAASLFHMAGYADLEFGKTYAPLATYRKQLVVVKCISKQTVSVNCVIKKELKLLRDITNQTTQNLTKFLGACVDDNNICTVWEYCERGSLQDILYKEDLSLEPMFISSLTCDLLNGLAFLHYSDLRYHGNLRSSNCVVDGRWTLKLTDFGVGELKYGENLDHLDEGTYFYRLFWTAPELLRHRVLLRPPHQLDRHMQILHQCLDGATVERHAKEHVVTDWSALARADIYALGVVLYELYSRQRPYFPITNTPLETVRRVIVLNDEFHVPFRPKLSQLSMVDKIITDCIESCWNEQPFQRPNIKQVRSRLKDNLLSKNRNIFDNMMTLMETHAKNLERLVNERTGQLVEEKKRTEELLYQMLPVPVAEQLKRSKKVEAEAFDSVTIYFSDIVGFTELSVDSTPFEIVQLLNDLYTTCDRIIAHYQVYKVETIGDAYMVVSGVPRRNTRHAGEIADMSIHLLQEITSSFVIRHRPGERLQLRVGINSGACCAGVVGTKMPRFCLFGDTVNMASRMETNGEPCRIHISEECKRELDVLGSYIVRERGEIQVKGRGQTRTYWLCGRTLPDGSAYTIDGCDQNHPHLPPAPKPRPTALGPPPNGTAPHKSPRSGKGPNFLARNFLPSKPRSKGSGKKHEPFPVFKGKASGHLNQTCAVEGPNV